jgi:uncharacterized Fe-S cluster protein YjdI
MHYYSFLFPLIVEAYTTVLYSDNISYDGLLGDRATTTSYCQNITTAFQCSNTLGFLGYETDTFNWHNPPGITLTNLVTGAHGQVVATNWTNLFSTSTLIASFVSTQIIPDESWWSGIGHDGLIRPNCNDWASNADNMCILGEYGKGGRSNKAWIDAGHADCSKLNKVICICNNGTVTDSPTASPTESPWLPTDEPSASPV